MKKILLCLTAMVTGVCIVHAQSNYLPGVIITKENDSLRGLINHLNWATNPATIEFKAENSAVSHVYKATEINGFVSLEKGAIFLSRHFTADVTYYETTTLHEQRPAYEMLDTTLFLEQLVAGSYSLYAYRDIHLRDHYLYEAAGEEVNELVYIKTIIPSEEGPRLFEKKQYQEQLDTLFQDYPKLARQTRMLLYYPKNLTKAFIAYNNYKHPSDAVVQLKKRNNPVWFGIVGGVGFNNYNYKGAVWYMNTVYKSSVNPTGGIFIDIPFKGASRRFSIYNEILYKTVNTSGILTAQYAGSLIEWDFSYVQVNLMAQYTYPKGFIRPFIHAGMGNAFIVKIKKNEFNLFNSTQKKEAISGVRKHEESAIVGIGARAGRFQMEGRLSTSSGWVPYIESSIAVNSFQIIASYRF